MFCFRFMYYSCILCYNLVKRDWMSLVFMSGRSNQGDLPIHQHTEKGVSTFGVLVFVTQNLFNGSVLGYLRATPRQQ